jgi:hypothetical protein
VDRPLAVDDAYWQVTLVQMGGTGSLALHLEPTRPAVPCSVCGQLSARRHSGY